MRKIYVFYADVFLMQNFIMDIIALVGVNYFLRRHRRMRYLILASALGAVAGLILLLMIKSPVGYALISHLLLNMLMVFVAFGRSKGKEFLENWAVTYLIFLLLGGMLEWLEESRVMLMNSLLMIAVGILGVYGILIYLMQRKNFRNHIMEAQISKGEVSLSVQAYWDSGNQLRDPYTGQGICILSEAKARELFGESRDHFRLVPYHSLGENSGLLWVTDVDELLIFDGKKTLRLPHAAVGIANSGLLERREYDFILHASFL